MKRYDDLTKLSDDDLVRRYTFDAAEHARFDAMLEQRDLSSSPILAAATACRVMALYAELRRRGREAQGKLSSLLTHSDVGVRKLAAWHTIEVAPREAESVLRAIAADGGMRGRSVELGLRAFADGTCPVSSDVPAGIGYPNRPALPEAERWPAVAVMIQKPSRIDDEAPELAEAFRRATLDKRREVAMVATEMALAEVGLSGLGDAVEDAQYALRFDSLPAHEAHANMNALAARFDDEASRAESDVSDEYAVSPSTLRCEARAVSSLVIALSGDSNRLDEVIHEALAAHDEPEGAIDFLTAMLTE